MKRIVPGLLLAGGWLLLLLFGSVQLFCLVVVPIVLVAAHEYVEMAVEASLPAVDRWLVKLILATPVLVTCLGLRPETLLSAVLFSFLALACYIMVRYREPSDSYGLFSRLVFGVIYIGLLGGYLVLLRTLPEGGSWLIIGSAITACSDSGAYYVGTTMGRRKLCPQISPKKTIEGALGGLLAGLVGALSFALLLLPEVNWPFLITASLLLVIAGIGGDLTESIIKRGTATKDSGRLLAGHGGVLDRIDSLLFVGPIFYHLLLIPGVQ